MGDRGIEAFLAGLKDGVLGYRVLLRGTNSIRVSNNIHFLRESPFRRLVVRESSDGGAAKEGPSSAPQNNGNEEDSLANQPGPAPNPEETGEESDSEQPATPEDSSPTEQQLQPTDAPSRSPEFGQREPGQQTSSSSQQQQVPNETQRDSSQSHSRGQQQSDDRVEQRRDEVGEWSIGGADEQQPGTSGQTSDDMSVRARSDRPIRPRKDPSIYVEDPIRLPSKRKRKPRKPAQVNAVTSKSNESSLPEEPQTFDQAMRSPHKDDWMSSMKEELSSMDALNVWTLMELPPGRRSLPCRWVFKAKRSAEGEIERFRSRLVLKGFMQREGIDYNELFSPTAKLETIRTVLNIGAKEKLFTYQFDVKTAFLYAELEDQEIFMTQPPGFEDGTKRVCKLNKSIYGLKQSNRMFHLKIKSIFAELGLFQSSADHCVFHSNDSRRLIIVLYVDDGVITGVNEKVILDFLNRLKQRLEIKFKILDYFLGLQIERTSNMGVIIHQQRYIQDLVEKYQMHNSKPVSTPVDRDIYSEDTTSSAEHMPYRELIGAILFLSSGCRPDISFTISFLSRYMHSPTMKLWNSAKRLLRYLNHTRNYGIRYDGDQDGKYQFFCDSDYAACPRTRKSTSGMVIVANGGPLFWASRKQSCTALSTCESETIAASDFAKVALWFHRLVSELGYHEIPRIQIDNQASLKLILESQLSRRTRHIEVRFHFIREKVDEKKLELAYVSSNSNLSDLMTKPFNRTCFQKLREAIGIKPVTNLRENE